ncbi:MAG: energy-coupling factor transporter transmembrane protein EcfT [Actinobacteria bacterium]|nr:energy-coupling factor transporter transmembrane protein EcfT [Actinomycetota bacterium]
MVGKNITIGQYLAKETALHGLDPRLKVIAVLAGTVVVFIYGSGWALLSFGVMLLLVLLASRMPLWPILKSVRTVWVIVLITALLQFFLTAGRVVFQWGFLSVTDTGLYNGIIFSARVIILVLLLAVLVMTTPPLRLADALSSFLAPLNHLKVPVGHVTTVFSITLLFIPNILEVSRKVMRAQMARGSDFESSNVFRRVKDIVPVLVPLFVKVFHDAEELALAMDARAYPESGVRTRLHPMHLGVLETALTLGFVGVAVGLIFIFSG